MTPSRWFFFVLGKEAGDVCVAGPLYGPCSSGLIGFAALMIIWTVHCFIRPSGLLDARQSRAVDVFLPLGRRRSKWRW